MKAGIIFHGDDSQKEWYLSARGYQFKPKHRDVFPIYLSDDLVSIEENDKWEIVPVFKSIF